MLLSCIALHRVQLQKLPYELLLHKCLAPLLAAADQHLCSWDSSKQCKAQGCMHKQDLCNKSEKDVQGLGNE